LFITYQITKTSISFVKHVIFREILDIEKELQNHLVRHTKGATECAKLFYNGAIEFPVVVIVTNLIIEPKI
jgi:hypothetical protein